MAIPDFLNTKLPLFSIRARGEWKKNKIFQVIRGKQVIRAYSEYDGSAKRHLIKFQSKFAAAVWRWQQMPYTERRWFISRAAKLGLQISGYNYFISLYMRDKLEDEVGYPDPHHQSHEKDGADELDLTGLEGVGLIVFRIIEGEAVIIEDFEQLFIADEFIIEGSGSLEINGNGLLAVY